MKSVPIQNSTITAWVDDSDFDAVMCWTWRLVNNRPCRYVPVEEHGRVGKSVGQYLHVFLMGERSGFEVDHRDRNPFNDQRDNLRWATRTQNLANQPKFRGSSQFKGVSWSKDHGKWRAALQFEGRKVRLGSFLNEESAALAYDKAARKYFGEFARPNFL